MELQIENQKLEILKQKKMEILKQKKLKEQNDSLKKELETLKKILKAKENQP